LDDFVARMDLKAALELYLFLEEREGELEGSSANLRASLLSYLYDRLSIEEMESPKDLLKRL
jgi:hypothetical protein